MPRPFSRRLDIRVDRAHGAAMIARALGLAVILTAAAPPTPLRGQFGGEQVNLIVGPAGSTLETGCASGSIAGPIHVDARGRFTARGLFEAYTAGPQRDESGPPPGTTAARFDGVVAGSALSLTVHPAAGPPLTFKLTHDRRVKLIRCY